MRWLLLCPLLFSACNTEKIAQLEKENKELRANLTAIELQEKCSKQALFEFKNGGWDKPEYKTFEKMGNLTNHYNSNLNKCFMEVDYFDSSKATANGAGIYRNRTIYDAYERKDYADLTLISKADKADWETPPMDCHVVKSSGKKQWCKSEEEFNELIKQFMEK